MLDSKYSFLVKEDVQILHGDNFGGQLAFDKVLFANSCYGLYKLECLKIQFFFFGKFKVKFYEMFFISVIYEGFIFSPSVVFMESKFSFLNWSSVSFTILLCCKAGSV